MFIDDQIIGDIDSYIKSKWAKEHDEYAQQITRNAQEFAKLVFSDQAIEKWRSQTIESYRKAFNEGQSLDLIQRLDKEQKHFHAYNLILGIIVVYAVIAFYMYKKK